MRPFSVKWLWFTKQTHSPNRRRNFVRAHLLSGAPMTWNAINSPHIVCAAAFVLVCVRVCVSVFVRFVNTYTLCCARETYICIRTVFVLHWYCELPALEKLRLNYSNMASPKLAECKSINVKWCWQHLRVWLISGVCQMCMITLTHQHRTRSCDYHFITRTLGNRRHSKYLCRYELCRHTDTSTTEQKKNKHLVPGMWLAQKTEHCHVCDDPTPQHRRLFTSRIVRNVCAHSSTHGH